MKLKKILNEILLESSEPDVEFVVSHTFKNDKGQKVTHYKLTGGYGGYARIKHSKDGFEVTNVILDHDIRGKGIGTKFYIKMNDESVKETGKTLQSIKPDDDGIIELSPDGKRLWDSLVTKGLAKKIGRSRYRFK